MHFSQSKSPQGSSKSRFSVKMLQVFVREATGQDPKHKCWGLQPRENLKGKEEKAHRKASAKSGQRLSVSYAVWPQESDSCHYNPNFPFEHNLVVEEESLGRAEHDYGLMDCPPALCPSQIFP